MKNFFITWINLNLLLFFLEKQISKQCKSEIIELKNAEFEVIWLYVQVYVFFL